MRVFMVTGEASGDMLAAALARAIREIAPEAKFAGVGGERMQEAGFALTTRTAGWASLGDLEALPRIAPLLAQGLRDMFRLRAKPVDLVVLVDFGVYNPPPSARVSARWSWRKHAPRGYLGYLGNTRAPLAPAPRSPPCALARRHASLHRPRRTPVASMPAAVPPSRARRRAASRLPRPPPTGPAPGAPQAAGGDLKKRKFLYAKPVALRAAGGGVVGVGPWRPVCRPASDNRP
jgi:hypothetical protein